MTDLNINDKGVLHTTYDRSENRVTRLWRTWNDPEPGFWEEHVATNNVGPLGGLDTFNDTRVFSNVGDAELSLRVYDRRIGNAMAPMYRGTPAAVVGQTFPIDSGVFVLRRPEVIFVSNDGATVPLIEAHAPGTAIRAFAVHRDANLMSWTEYSAGDRSVRIWKSPLVTRREDVRAELVTRIPEYRDLWQTGGTTFRGSGGYVVSAPELDTLLVTRLADGMSWPVKLGTAPHAVRDPRPVQLVVQIPLWVDQEDLYATVGPRARDTVESERVVHFRMADLGPPSLLPLRN